MYIILSYIARFLALLIVLPLHEWAHAFAAIKCGDPTPRLYGRYTLNPLAHFDKLGLLCFVVAGFGWAKPVPINPRNFRNFKSGCFYTSIAGVAANYLLAFIAFPIYVLAYMYVPTFGYYTEVLVMTLRYVVTLSLVFFVFNLLPIYPLDGFRVMDVFVQNRGNVYWFLRTKGVFILYGLFALSLLADFTGLSSIDILGNTISYIVELIQVPIIKFWGLIFGV